MAVTYNSTRSICYDGDFRVAKPVGLAIPEYPFPRDPTAIIYRQRFQQLQAEFRRLTLDSSGPNNSYLVDETTPTDIGSGIVEWDRVWATIPADRDEWESYVHSCQFIITEEDSASVGEISIVVNSRIRWEYALVRGATSGFAQRGDSLNSSSENLPFEPLRAYRLVEIAGAVFTIGTRPSGAEIVAEDSEVALWMGSIAFRRTRYVPLIDPVAYITS